MSQQVALDIASDSEMTKQILSVLQRRYGQRIRNDGVVVGDWLGIEEARAGAGYSHKDAERRIDYFAIHSFPSKNNHHRIAFEVKVSRGDWLREMKDASKRRMGLMFSNEFYFVTPRGLVTPEEIPAECGLMEFDATRAWPQSLYIKVKAPWRDSHPPTWSFFVSVLRNAMRS